MYPIPHLLSDHNLKTGVRAAALMMIDSSSPYEPCVSVFHAVAFIRVLVARVSSPILVSGHGLVTLGVVIMILPDLVLVACNS